MNKPRFSRQNFVKAAVFRATEGVGTHYAFLFLAACLLCATACKAPRPPAYTVTGTIQLTSYCNAPTSPMEVTMKAGLANIAGTNVIGGSNAVTLTGTPPAPLTGTYRITVNGGADMRTAANWTDFRVVAPNGDPVCKAIGCPASAPPGCVNIADLHRTVAAVRPPDQATENIRVLCTCVD